MAASLRCKCLYPKSNVFVVRMSQVTDLLNRFAKANYKRPNSCCLWCTTSCDGWQLPRWLGRPLGTLCNRLRWSMRPFCVWSTARIAISGTVAGISLAPPLKPCAESSSRNARRKERVKHGGQWQRVEFTPESLAGESSADQILAVHDALTQFEAEFPDKALVVKLRYFAGLSNAEVAEAMGVGTATAQRYWQFARAWLFQRLTAD